LIVLQCTVNNQPFNSVKDKYYCLETEMLCSSTQLPTPSTVSKDIKNIYKGLSIHVHNYFKV
ncbi:uncharacterized protein FOMMEDRAFT_39890, partial [Fomitiporia mediterranea MF3/22]|uniref:uncharacterized protein n=1 Tax=Fomitiporia mediterranea (strain MF3/22) TaxID=694068 RepID=UPI0004408239